MNFDFDRDKKRARHRKTIFKILIWIIEIVVVVLLAFYIINFALEKTTMLGSSMEVTLKAEDKVIINKLAYVFGDPKRYDVIVFKQSGDEHNYYNIKRIIGLPGETVQIKGGFVYINGEVLEEPMVVDPIQMGGLANDELVLEEDEYFVLGDNRNNSEDSRFANIGNVVYDDIIGRAWIRLSPFDFISKINKYNKNNEEVTETKDTETEESTIEDPEAGTSVTVSP